MSTLFYDIEIAINYFYNRCGVQFSHEFMFCADTQLSEYFEKKTGIKINKHVGFSSPESIPNFYTKGEISNFKTYLYVNHNWNPIAFCWKSKSGRIYDISDADVDCNDIVFWLEGLDNEKIYKQLFPGEKLPFKLKPLSYELIVTRFNMDCTFKIKPEEQSYDFNKIKTQLSDFINQYNNKSEKSKKFKGVIHNCKFSIDANTIICELDMGSAGFDFIKKFLLFIDKLLIAKSVEIC